MPTRIYWAPAEPPADFYEVKSAPTNIGTFDLLAVVTDQRPGPYWDAVREKFYFDDAEGDDNTVYRVQGFLDGGLVSDTGVFQPEVSKSASVNTRQRVDQNYQMVDALRYISPGGSGIPQATIRVFRKPDWDAGLRATSLFVTETDNDGRWVSPFWLEPGMMYVIVFEKAGSFGPDRTEITV